MTDKSEVKKCGRKTTKIPKAPKNKDSPKPPTNCLELPNCGVVAAVGGSKKKHTRKKRKRKKRKTRRFH